MGRDLDHRSMRLTRRRKREGRISRGRCRGGPRDVVDDRKKSGNRAPRPIPRRNCRAASRGDNESRRRRGGKNAKDYPEEAKRETQRTRESARRRGEGPSQSTHVSDDTRKRLTSRRGHKEGVEDRRRQARMERLQKRRWFCDAVQRIGLTFGPFESSSSAIFVTQLRCLCGLRIAQNEP